MSPAHHLATNELMVRQARLALKAYGAGDMVAFKTHAARARELADELAPELHCPECHTTYLQPQECDWCPGHQAIHASNPATF